MKKSLPTMLGIVIAAFILVAGPLSGPARADHSTGTLGSLSCYSCHSFSAPNVEPGTTSLSVPSMTQLKEAGWVPGTRVGCVYCHRANYSSRIPDALTPFAGATPAGSSRHPVSRNFVTGTIDNTPYLSNDNTNTAQHLDCKDCHSTALVGMPDHDVNWLNSTAGTDNAKRSTNPYALKNVSKPKAYDNLCRSCHQSAAAFQAFTGKSGAGAAKLVLASHDNGVDNTTNGIKDIDNTLMRTSTPQKIAYGNQCTACHDAHESQNEHLYSDGHELDNTGVAETAISELTNCTNVCHYRGDAAGGYDSHGHGKATNWEGISLARDCTFCHDVGQPHNMASANYVEKYRFPALDNSWLTTSVYGKPQRSVCATCHSSKPLHVTAKGTVGCLDCHEQHAKNSDNNVMMIRNTNVVEGARISGMTAGAGYGLYSESVLFQRSPKYPGGTDNDFFTNTAYNVPGSLDNTNTGFCDQRACHGAGSTSGTPYIPMAAYLSSGKHTGGNQALKSNCESCHKHEDGGGSFAANQSCTSCHGQPPPPSDNQAGNSYAFLEALSPHVIHASTYAIGCKTCHYKFVDNSSHNTPSRTYQSIFFDNAAIRLGALTPYYNPDNSAGLNCENIWCHSDGRGGNPKDNGFKWYITPAPGAKYNLGCDGCHGGDPAIFPAQAINTGAHAKHLAQGYKCSYCHVKTVVTDCNIAINPTTGSGASHKHVDNVRNVNIAATYDMDGIDNNNFVGGSCSGITCHGGNPVNWTTDVGRVTCDKCHISTTGDVDDFGTGTFASMNGGPMAKIDNTQWNTRGHGLSAGQYPVDNNPAANLLAGSTGTNKCAFCHNPAISHDNAANPFRLANENAFAGTGWNGNCYKCHADASVGDSSAGYDPADDGTGTYAAKTATLKVADEHYNWSGSSGSNSRHTGVYNGGKFCFDCHDPHGDNNIVMIGARVSRRTDNTYGIPTGGNDNSQRPTVAFSAQGSGAAYASVDNAAPFDGVCEACHEAASGITHFWNAASNNHISSTCTGCHAHNSGFKGQGGSNQEQFFDNAYNGIADCTVNYRDISGHRVTAGTTTASLFDGGQVNCYQCHGTQYGTQYYSNECLKCHWESRSGAPTHPNGTFEWATATAPATQYATYPSGSAQTNDALCLQCHDRTAPAVTLNGLANPKVIPTGESWTGGSGHGATAKLSPFNPGPPAYNCAACHYSSAAQATGAVRDQTPPTFHASRNRKLVVNDNVSTSEYPSPQYTGFTVNQRSTAMDGWCASKCHRNGAAPAKDDNVIDHTWSVIGGQVKAAGQSHPTNFTLVDNTRYRALTSADNLALSDYMGGTLPGTGNVICTTCHDPHGGWDYGTGSNPVSGGLRNMLILSPADNASTLCKKCHE